MITRKALKLSWSRFTLLSEARKAFAVTPCVYAQTDKKGNVIRVGKAGNGLDQRYHGGNAYAMDAAMHGSRNFVFVAAVPRALCSRIESQLIWEFREQLHYNQLGKKKQPVIANLRLVHLGDTPFR